MNGVQQSAVDVYFMVKELQQFVGSRIDQLYQYDEKTFSFRFYIGGVGKKELFIHVPSFVYITSQKPPALLKQHSFVSRLRKVIKGGHIVSLYQLGFDRKIVFECQCKGELHYLIIELHDKGNVILSRKEDDSYLVDLAAEVQRWSDRTITRGNEYSFENRPFPHECSVADIALKLSSYDGVLSKCLATSFGLGGQYAKVVCESVGLDANMHSADVDASVVLLGFQKLFTQELSPMLLKKGNSVKVYPFAVVSDGEQFSTFSEAYDSYITPLVLAEVEAEKNKAQTVAQKKVERILTSQSKSQEKLEKEIEENQAIAEYIQSHYAVFEKVLAELKTSQDASYVVSHAKKERSVIVDTEKVDGLQK